MPERRRGRRLLDRAVTAGAAACALLACAVLVAIAFELVRRGAPALGWRFVVRASREAGAAGGVVYQLLGTAILIVTALAVALPPAVAAALLATVYAPGRVPRRALRRALYTLNGVPSVVFGVFGLVLFVRFFGWGKSWLAGGILLGVMILPTLALALAERIDAIPRDDLDAARALGLRRSQVVWAVILPQSAGGLVSGATLGLARAAGETAPILFAAAVFSGVTVPRGVVDSPVLALPYHIFVLAQDTFDPAAETHLWAAASVLLGLVLLLSALALPARLAVHEEARRG